MEGEERSRSFVSTIYKNGQSMEYRLNLLVYLTIPTVVDSELGKNI